MSDLISRETAQAEINCLLDRWGYNQDGGKGYMGYEFAHSMDLMPSADIMECARAIKEYCEKHECERCDFADHSISRGTLCGLQYACPCGWDLPEGEAKPNESLIKDCCEAQGHLWADNNIFEDVEENQ